VCTACAPVVAAPVPTGPASGGPTPTKTPKPELVTAPEPAATPDPLWVDLLAGLQKNVRVCLVNAQQFDARIPTGIMVAASFHWISTSDGVRAHTIRVTEETLTKEGLAEYETFLFDSEVALSGFERVVVHIEIGSRWWELWFPVGMCPPPTASQL